MKSNKTRIVISYILGMLSLLLILYPPSAQNFNGDSYEYFGIAKDVFANGGNYFNWTTAAGYNLFSLNYLLSLLIGAVTYNSPIIFFLIINFIEVLLLWFSFVYFYSVSKIINPVHRIQNIHAYFLLMVLIIALYFKSDGFYSNIFATDLFLILYDSFIIFMCGWGLVLNRVGAVTKNKLLLYLLMNLYLCSTDLRFCSIGISTQLVSLWLLYLQNKQRNFFKIPIVLSLKLVAIAASGYFLKFILDFYSADSFYFMSLPLSFIITSFHLKLLHYFDVVAKQNILSWIFNALFWIGFLLGSYFIYLTVLKNIIHKKLMSFMVDIHFLQLGTISIVITSLLIIFSRMAVFSGASFIGLRYYELSVILILAGIIFFIVNQFKIIDYYVNNFMIHLGFISLVLAGYGFTNSYDLAQLPEASLAGCVAKNQARYDLNDGIGEYWSARPVSAQLLTTEVYPFASDNLIAFDFNWLSSIYPKPIYVNFLIYKNIQYFNKALNQVYSMVPQMIIEKNINCGEDGGIVVFDKRTAKFLTLLLLQQAQNYRSWFYMNTYSSGQALWQQSMFNQQYIHNHNHYYYSGVLLTKTGIVESQIIYTNLPDYSATVKYTGVSSKKLLFLNSERLTYNYADSIINVALNYNTRKPIRLVVFQNNPYQIFMEKELLPSESSVEFKSYIPAGVFYLVGVYSTVDSGGENILNIRDLTIQRLQ